MEFNPCGAKRINMQKVRHLRCDDAQLYDYHPTAWIAGRQNPVRSAKAKEANNSLLVNRGTFLDT